MKIPIVVSFLIVLVSLPTAAGLSAPNVTFIPPQISAGASFIAIASGDVANPVRVSWIVPSFAVAYGSFPKVGNMFVCYFSDNDATATCGPTPFTVSTIGFGPYTMLLDSINQLGETSNATVLVDAGGITLTSDVTVENDTVFMEIFPGGALASSVTYAVYYQENLSMLTPGYVTLTKNVQTGSWLGNIELSGGGYYLAFSAVSEDNFGGEVMKVSILRPSDSGECSSTSVDGGDYPLQAEDVSLSVLINSGQHYEQTGFTITNLRNETLSGLSIVVPSDFSSYLSISLDTTSLAQNDTTFFTITLDNIQNSMTINTVVDVISGTNVVGQISVNIPVSIIGGGSQVCPSGGAFTLQPNVWSGDFLIESVSKVFTITNNDDSSLTDITYSATGSIDDIATVSLPTTIPSSGTGSVDISLDPTVSGNYRGSIVIETGAGEEIILVNVNFFNDISFQLESLESEFDDLQSSLTSDQLFLLSDTLDNIESSLAEAKSRVDFGDYGDAEKSFIEAQSQIAALSDISSCTPPPSPAGSSGEFDSTSIIIVVVVLVIIVAAVFIIKKKKEAAGEENIEEELDEELEETMT